MRDATVLVVMCMGCVAVAAVVAAVWWSRQQQSTRAQQHPTDAVGPAPSPAGCALTEEEVMAWARGCEPNERVSSNLDFNSKCVLAKAMRKCGKPMPSDPAAPGLFTAGCPDPYPDIYRPGMPQKVTCGCSPCRKQCYADVGTEYYRKECAAKA